MRWTMRIKSFFSGKSLLISDSHIPLSFRRYFVPFSGDFRDRIRNSNGLEDVFGLYEDMSRTRPLPNVIQFTQLLSRLVSLKKYDAAICLFKDICGLGIPVNAYSLSIAINSCCLSLRSVFDSLPAPNVQCYNILINGYCRNKIDDALHIFREMPSKGVEPNVATYSTILKGLFRSGRCSAALEIFNELQTVGLKPNFYTYCNMLEGLGKNGEVERALLLLDELEHRGNEHVHITYYSIVMDGLCESKNLDAARAIFRGLAAKGVEPSVVTYNILIKGCCQNGLMEEAKDLVLEMEQANLLPNEFTYNILVQGFLWRGEFDAAERVVEQMKVKGFSPFASTCELYARKKFGRFPND